MGFMYQLMRDYPDSPMRYKFDGRDEIPALRKETPDGHV